MRLSRFYSLPLVNIISTPLGDTSIVSSSKCCFKFEYLDAELKFIVHHLYFIDDLEDKALNMVSDIGKDLQTTQHQSFLLSRQQEEVSDLKVSDTVKDIIIAQLESHKAEVVSTIKERDATIDEMNTSIQVLVKRVEELAKTNGTDQ